MNKQNRSPAMEQCIQECQDCHATCIEMVTHSLTAGAALAQPSHSAILLDCAEICHVSEDSMRRSSPLAQTLCAACAAACDACATACERFAGDEQMKACAERCRRCAEACRKMASARA